MNRSIDASGKTPFLVLKHGNSHNAVLTTENNTTRIVSGTFKAKHGHYINETYRTSYKPIVNKLLRRLEAFLNVERFHRAKYKEGLDCIIANLIHASKYSLSLVYARSDKDRIHANIIDFLESISMIHSIIGKSNEYNNNSSWCVASPEFKLLVETHKVKQIFKKGSTFIQIKEGKKKGNQKRKVIQPSKWVDKKYAINKANQAAFTHNTHWLDHSITLDGKPLAPYIFRSFIDSLNLGGRFYGRVLAPMTIGKNDRPRILIDGEKTAELDYSAIHPHIMYANEGLQLNDCPYQIEGFQRETAKAALLILINSDVNTWLNNIERSASPKMKRLYKRLGDCKATKGFIKNIPEGCIANELLASIKTAHEPVASQFGSKDLGLRLQRQDSEVMGRILIACSIQGITAYPVHDSVICKDSDKQTVKDIMHRAYETVTNFSIKITEKG